MARNTLPEQYFSYFRSSKRVDSIRQTIKEAHYLSEGNQIRFEPIAVLIQGRPGCGKTVFATRFLHRLNIPTFFMNSLDEFFDGAEGCHAILIDEFMPIRAGESPDIVNFVRMISSAPFRPNFARMELKGSMITPAVCICTTNQDINNLNTPYFTAAISRRFVIKVDMDTRLIYHKSTNHILNEDNFLNIFEEEMLARLARYNLLSR